MYVYACASLVLMEAKRGHQNSRNLQIDVSCCVWGCSWCSWCWEVNQLLISNKCPESLSQLSSPMNDLTPTPWSSLALCFHLTCFCFWDTVLCSPGCPQNLYIAKDDLELLIFLPSPPECWKIADMPSHLVSWNAGDWSQGCKQCETRAPPTDLSYPYPLFFRQDFAIIAKAGLKLVTLQWRHCMLPPCSLCLE